MNMMADIGKEVDQINAGRAVEIEGSNIATVNDQILEHDASIAQNDADIDACRDRIRACQKDTKRRERLKERLRQRREIFRRAEFELRTTEQP